MIPGLRQYPNRHNVPQQRGDAPATPSSAAVAAHRAQPRAGWNPPPQGWQQERSVFQKATNGDEEQKVKKALPYSLSTAQIWKAFCSGTRGGVKGRAVSSLTQEEIIEAFKRENGIELDAATVESMVNSEHPQSGEAKYPDGKLSYDQFIFEMQLLAPYAGSDKQAYLYIRRDAHLKKVAEQKGVKAADAEKLASKINAKKARESIGKDVPQLSA